MRDIYLKAMSAAMAASRRQLAPATPLTEDTADIAADLVTAAHPLPRSATKRIVIAR